MGVKTESHNLDSLSLQVERNKTLLCRQTVRKFTCICGAVGFKPINCGKWWCPTCGNEYEYYKRKPSKKSKRVKYGMRLLKMGPIHYRHLEAYLRRVDSQNEFARSYVFTLSPEENAEIIAHPERLEQCIKSLKELMLGNHKTGKNAKAGEHENTKVCFQLHVHGDDLREGLKLHFNIQIWESHNAGLTWKISPEKLARIKKRWNAAKCQIFEARSVSNVHYRYNATTSQCRKLANYMTRTPDPAILDHISVKEQRFLLLHLRGNQYCRYWGLASSSHKEAWAKNRPVVSKKISCPDCGNPMQAAVETDKDGNPRPVIMTRERLELELEGGYNLIDHGYILQLVKRQAAEPEAAAELGLLTVTEDAVAVNFEGVEWF